MKQYGLYIDYHRFIIEEATDFENAKTGIKEVVTSYKVIPLPYRYMQLFGLSSSGTGAVRTENDPSQRNFLFQKTFIPKEEDFIICEDQKWYISTYKLLLNQYLIITAGNTVQNKFIVPEHQITIR